MKPKILLVGIALIGLLALPACQTSQIVSQDPNTGLFTTNIVRTLDTNQVDRAANQAAIDGTTDILGAHPEWRPQFQQAEDDLNILANSPSVGLDDVLAIAQRLPVKELKSPIAQLSFQGATFAISLFDVPQLPGTANADVQSLAKAIANGIATGISNAPPVPVKPPKVAAPQAIAPTNGPATN